MENQFVSDEIASKLKDKGFNQPCFGGWDQNKEWHYHPDSDIVLDAPLWQQAIDWFREVHDIHIWVESWGLKIRTELNHKEYEGCIKYKDKSDMVYSEYFDDYLKARQSIIEHALTLI